MGLHLSLSRNFTTGISIRRPGPGGSFSCSATGGDPRFEKNLQSQAPKQEREIFGQNRTRNFANLRENSKAVILSVKSSQGYCFTA